MSVKSGRRFTPDTVSLGNQVIQEVKDRGIIGKGVLEKKFGKRYGGLENVYIYITDVEPRIAETDDGKLLWVE
jgi:hypothetical protein